MAVHVQAIRCKTGNVVLPLSALQKEGLPMSDKAMLKDYRHCAPDAAQQLKSMGEVWR